MRISDWSSDVCSSDLLAGDQAIYSVALENQSNLDAPYTYFQIGVPELGSNQYVYGLRFLDFFANVRGAPEGVLEGVNAIVPWLNLEIGRASCRERVFQYV